MRIAMIASLGLCLSLALASQKPTDAPAPPAAAPGEVKQPAEGVPPPAAAPAKAAGGLDESLALAVQQLEQKKYLEMLERFVAPADREKVKAEGGSWEKIAESFGQDKAPSLLERLKLAQKQKPELTPEGDRATYRGDPEAEGIGGRDLVWERVDGVWYLRN